MSEQPLWVIGLTLIFSGFAIIFIAFILLFSKGVKGRRSKLKSGGVVIIGPIPIIFGTDKKSVITVLGLSIILMILLLVWIFVQYEIFH